MELTQVQWELLEPVISKSLPPKLIAGRPRRHDKDILNGILWICRTGAPWKDLPSRYPPYQTCHRRFQEWVKQGVWMEILTLLAVDLKRRGKIDMAETYMDGSFSSAKKGALELEKPGGARVPRSWQLQTAMVFLSPFPHMKQIPMRLNLLKKHYQAALLKQNPNEL
jgi:transposase